MSFTLDPRLESSTTPLAELPLCTLLLSQNATWPWLILVPRRTALEEIIDLPFDDRAQLWREVDAVSEALKSITKAEKLNIGALGNVVRQLHIHVVARNPSSDPAGMGPIWGTSFSEAYTSEQKENLESQLKEALKALII